MRLCRPSFFQVLQLKRAGFFRYPNSEPGNCFGSSDDLASVFGCLFDEEGRGCGDRGGNQIK